VKTDSVTQPALHGADADPAGHLSARLGAAQGLSGNLPEARVAGWAGDATGALVGGLTGPADSASFPAYGDVVTVSAIVGTGARGGVDMAWGDAPVYGHFGIDLTGPNSGQVRIESLRIEDVTSVFHRKLMDWVDVLDFGAVGDGVTDDRDAFLAADAAAAGREVLVPAGTYFIGSNLTMTAPVRFEGTLAMPDAARLVASAELRPRRVCRGIRRRCHGPEEGASGPVQPVGFRGLRPLRPPRGAERAARRAGRRRNKTTYANRRVIRNGQLTPMTAPAGTTRSMCARPTGCPPRGRS
jgi:hypothetical protein